MGKSKILFLLCNWNFVFFHRSLNLSTIDFEAIKNFTNEHFTITMLLIYYFRSVYQFNVKHFVKNDLTDKRKLT